MKTKGLKNQKKCHCYGSFDENERWGFEKSSEFPEFGQDDITILYKGSINVFYGQVKHAIEDGYKEYKAH